VEDPGLDRPEHLGHQPVEPAVRRPVAGRPVAVGLGLLCLGQHVEAELEVFLVGEAIHPSSVAVNRELEGSLDPEVGVLLGGGISREPVIEWPAAILQRAQLCSSATV
jgi:hypothetical protein